MKKIKLYNLLAIIGILSAMTYYTLSGSSIFKESLKVLLVLNILCGSILIMFQKRTVNIRELLLLLFFLFLYYRLKDTRLVIALFTIICAINLSTEKVIKLIFYTDLFCFILVMITGGYSHINGTALHFFILMLLYSYLNRNKSSSIYNIIPLLLYIIFSLITKSGSLILCGGLFLLLLFTQNTKINNVIINSKVVSYIFVYCFIFNLLGAVYINVNRFEIIRDITPSFVEIFLKNIFIVVDKLTTSRIQLANQSLYLFGFSLFGGNVDYSLLSDSLYYFNLDSGYMWMLQGFGIIITIMYLCFTVSMLKKAQNNNDKYVLYISIVIALLALNEDVLMCIGTNLCLAFFSKYLKNINEDKENLNENT